MTQQRLAPSWPWRKKLAFSECSGFLHAPLQQGVEGQMWGTSAMPTSGFGKPTVLTCLELPKESPSDFYIKV